MSVVVQARAVHVHLWLPVEGHIQVFGCGPVWHSIKYSLYGVQDSHSSRIYQDRTYGKYKPA